ncbi:MAG TPA: DUF1330 domain-containing protein [Burkholderiales bacterium]|jgi:uncharacterized protein (DUF1330 family)
MPAYAIVNIDVQDARAYEEYRSRSLATVQKFGGRFIVRGGQYEVREGDWVPKRVVVLEFPDMDTARRWYDSDTYQSIIPYRSGCAKTDMVLVEGV